MNVFLVAVALFLLLNFGLGSWRVFRGPTRADRMMAAQLFGSTGVAILLLLSFTSRIEALVDIALVFGLLAAVAVVAFVQRSGHPERNVEPARQEIADVEEGAHD